MRVACLRGVCAILSIRMAAVANSSIFSNKTESMQRTVRVGLTAEGGGGLQLAAVR